MYGELLPLGGGDPIPLLKTDLIVGRREGADIVLRFPNVSGHHCELSLGDGYWTIKDLRSSNGTKVNGTRVSEQQLKPGDKLSIANHEYEIAYDPLRYLEFILDHVYGYLLEKPEVLFASERAVGTMPHALLAIFHGDYVEACQAYKKAFPQERYVVLNDYNNREIDDSFTALRILGSQLYAVRCDTCGENFPQLQPGVGPALGYQLGVSPELITSLRGALDEAGGQHVNICASSGFDSQKLSHYHATPLDIVGTGSFLPKWPIATADIFEVDGRPETKTGRGWGLEKNKQFDRLMVRSSPQERSEL